MITRIIVYPLARFSLMATALALHASGRSPSRESSFVLSSNSTDTRVIESWSNEVDVEMADDGKEEV